MNLVLATSALALPLALLPGPSGVAGVADGPPGLIHFKGGRTVIGLKQDDIQKLLDENEALRKLARTLDSENTGKSTLKIDVDPFYLGVTEVTNEQYLAFVQATGHRPPMDWGEQALDERRLAFLDAENELKRQAKEEGRTYTTKKWDTATKKNWWSKNWADAAWEMPAEIARRPVVHVDFSDVLAYCKWTGLRPMSENEYQHASRTNTERVFPWGEDWEDGKFAATSEVRRINHTMDVGSFAAGATKEGLFDLSGNVYEWTSTPYKAHKGFKKTKFKFGKGKNEVIIENEPQWDGNQRVAVGGCYQTPWAAARVTHRRATDRTQLTNALGFRVAASPQAGVDVATLIEQFTMRNADARADGIAFAPDLTLAIDRWESTQSSGAVPEGYAIITNYAYMVFTPIQELAWSQDADLKRASHESPAQLGYLSTNQVLVQPELAPGDYLVAYRAKGKKRRAKTDEEEVEGGAPSGPSQDEDPALDEGLEQDEGLAGQIDINESLILFLDPSSGEVVASIPVSPAFEKVKALGAPAFVEKKVWIDRANKVQETQNWTSFPIAIPTKVRNRALKFTLELLMEPEAQTQKWRTSGN